MSKKYLFANMIVLFAFQVLAGSCLFGQKKVVVTKAYSTSEPGWSWDGAQWRHPEKTDTIPFSYQVKTTVETQITSDLTTSSECRVSEKSVSLGFSSPQTGWTWNSDRHVWLFNGNAVNAFPGEYVVVWMVDMAVSECKTKKIISQTAGELRINYCLAGSGWKWDEQKFRWLLNGVAKTPEYRETKTTETHKTIEDNQL